MPCWIPFSLAVPGFALRNRSRVVRDLCVVGGGGSIVRAAAHFSRSNVSVHPRCTLCTVGVERLVGCVHSITSLAASDTCRFSRNEFSQVGVNLLSAILCARLANIAAKSSRLHPRKCESSNHNPLLGAQIVASCSNHPRRTSAEMNLSFSLSVIINHPIHPTSAFTLGAPCAP